METEGEHIYAVCSVLRDVGITEICCDGKIEWQMCDIKDCDYMTVDEWKIAKEAMGKDGSEKLLKGTGA